MKELGAFFEKHVFHFKPSEVSFSVIMCLGSTGWLAGVILGAGAPRASGRSGSIKVAPLSNGMRAFPENVDFMEGF